MQRIEPPQVEWRISPEPVGYEAAVAFMEGRVAEIAARKAAELVWLLEHPALYTAGTSAKPEDLLTPSALPVFRSGRGGQYTYHGPGQRIAYAMLDLSRRGGDLRAYVRGLEEWAIRTLADFGVKGERREGRVGVWVVRENGREDKIAAIGVRVRRSVSFHGLSLNIAPDLSHYAGIVPCGIREHGVTSLADLGIAAGMAAVDRALQENFAKVFGGMAMAGPADAAAARIPGLTRIPG